MDRMIADRASRRLSRRQFMRSIAGLGLSAAGLALLDGCGSQPAGPATAQSPLETTTLRVIVSPAICIAPQYLAEDFLKYNCGAQPLGCFEHGRQLRQNRELRFRCRGGQLHGRSRLV